MKKMLFLLVLLGVVLAGHSQILLKEAKVSYKPVSMKLDPYTNSLTLKVNEMKAGEFGQDPLMYVKNNFDAYSLINSNKDEPYDSYQVWFESKKGYLLANFDKDGKLLSSSQRFKNVYLPAEIRNSIIREYGNVKLVNSKYIATSKGWDLDKQFYRVKIKDSDNKTKVIRLEAPAKRAIAGL